MKTVGIAELKAKLSGYVEGVRSGQRVLITDHGEEAAIISPISEERKLIMSLVKAGKAQWSGDGPSGINGLVVRGKPLSDTVLEERG